MHVRSECALAIGATQRVRCDPTQCACTHNMSNRLIGGTCPGCPRNLRLCLNIIRHIRLLCFCQPNPLKWSVAPVLAVYQLSSLWVSRTQSASDWYALQEALYKCIDTIQYNSLCLHWTGNGELCDCTNRLQASARPDPVRASSSSRQNQQQQLMLMASRRESYRATTVHRQ